MFDVLQTVEFEAWLNMLRDKAGKAKITTRIQRLELGNQGDVAPIGEGISEMRIHAGPGYRVYFKQTATTIVLLLCGGDKSSQRRDIERAKVLAADLKTIERYER